MLQEWLVLDGDLPFPGWLGNVGFVPLQGILIQHPSSSADGCRTIER